ncbi:MAG: hypothetical protein Q9166_006534 [cf. Caloplaca sp. 2 TL-2023]
MPTAPKLKARFKRPREKQDPEIGKRLKSAAHAKAIRDHERSLYELEKHTEDLQDAEQAFEAKLARIEALEGQKSRLSADIVTKKKELREITALNGDLKEDLLKHQPSDQMADSQIIEQYELLQENISSWVDTEVRRFEDHWKADHDGQYPQLNVFRPGSTPEYAKMLTVDLQFGGEYLAQSLVHYQLHEQLFQDHTLSFALDKGEVLFLDTAEEGVAKLNPPRDVSAIRYMRSEILKGFATSALFQKRRANWMSQIGTAILQVVETVLPETQIKDDSVRMGTFRKRVLEPAFDLAVALKISSTCYDFSERLTVDTQFKTFPLRFYHWDYCTMIDIQTRQIPKKKTSFGNEDKLIGAQQVLFLAPGLLRIANEDVRRLTKDIVCVKLDPSLILDGNTVIKKKEEFPAVIKDEHTAIKTKPEVPEVISDGSAVMKAESEGPDFMDDVGSVTVITRPPMGKMKDRYFDTPVDVDARDQVSAETTQSRPQRVRKPPLAYPGIGYGMDYVS